MCRTHSSSSMRKLLFDGQHIEAQRLALAALDSGVSVTSLLDLCTSLYCEDPQIETALSAVHYVLCTRSHGGNIHQKLLSRTLTFIKSSSAAVRKYALGSLSALTASESSPFWCTLIGILEALEEAQQHLVMPVLQHQLPVLINALTTDSLCLGVLAADWLLQTFARAFRHANGPVRLWMAMQYLQLPDIRFLRLNQQFFIDEFLKFLNNNDLFARLFLDDYIDVFCQKASDLFDKVIVSVIPEGSFLASLEAFLSFNWAPVPLYFAVRFLSGIKLVDHCHSSAEIVTKIWRLMLHVSELSVPLLRASVQRQLLHTVVAFSDWTAFDSFSQLLNISAHLPNGILVQVLQRSLGRFCEVNVCAVATQAVDAVDNLPMLHLWAILLGTVCDAQPCGDSQSPMQQLLGHCTGQMSKCLRQLEFSQVRLLRWLAFTNHCLTECQATDSACNSLTRHLTHDELHSLMASSISSLTSAEQPFDFCMDIVEHCVSPLMLTLRASTCQHCRSGYLAHIGTILNGFHTWTDESNLHYCFLRLLSALNFRLSDETELEEHFSEEFLRKLMNLDGSVKIDCSVLAKSTLIADYCRLITTNDIRRKEVLLLSVQTVSLPENLCTILDCINIADAAPIHSRRELNVIYRVILEYRRSEQFIVLLESFLKLVIKPDSIHETICSDLKGEAEANPIIAEFMARRMRFILREASIEKFDGGSLVWCLMLVDLAVFGPPMRRDQILVYSACEREAGFEHSYDSISAHCSAQRTRAVAIESLWLLVQANSAASSAIANATCCKFDENSTLRTFPLSPSHRMQSRCAQLLLTFHKSADKACRERLFEHCVTVLTDPVQQQSVKVLTQWLLCSICLLDEQLMQRLLLSDQEFASKRVGSMASWISVLTKVASPQQIFTRVLPWCVVHNFAVRCTALAAVQQAYNAETHSSEFPHIGLLLSCRLDKGSQPETIKELIDNNWYFGMRDLQSMFCLETIYLLLPQLCEMPFNECLRQEWFSADFLYEFNWSTNGVANSNLHQKLPSSKTGDNNKTIASDSWEGAAVVSQFQTKATDYSSLVPLSNDLSASKSTNGKSSLIVVASLLDRGYNLGGLCRSCEIFGAESLVLSDVKVAETQDFKRVSLTSEKHIQLIEVQLRDLASFLMTRKSEGYEIIGAEQTTASVKLHEFHFPAKSVLLLGSERRGIPVDLLSHVDAAVEIRQSGLVKSLNVHVTGAIFAYEFSKQRHFDA